MSEPTDKERLAVSESRIEDLIKAMETMNAKIDSVNEAFTRYKGFIGGVMFALSGLWMVLLMFKEKIIKALFGS